MLYSKAHAFYNGSIVLRSHLRLALRKITLVLRVLMDMGHEKPATISYGDSEVTELQRSAGDITLSHASPPDRLTIPSILIATVQIVSTCKESALLTRDIDMHRS